MKQKSSGGKIGNGLVAAGSAAVLAVYAAGYARTQSVEDEASGRGTERRSAAPRQSRPAVAAAAAPEPGQPALMAKMETPREASNAPVNPSPEKAAPVVEPKDSAPKTEAVVTPVPVPAPAPAPVVATPQPAPVQTAVVAPPPPPPAPAKPGPPPNPAAPPWKDGTFEAWGSCRHGDIQAAVVIQGGKIISAAITQCDTRYSCDVIDRLIPQVAQRQNPDVDTVSGATESGDAFSNAVFAALSKAH